MPRRLDPEEKRLRLVTAADLADEAGVLKLALERIKDEAIRRGLRRAVGQYFQIALTPPGTQLRSDRASLLRVLGITESEYQTRFCHETKTDWRLTCNPVKPPRPAA